MLKNADTKELNKVRAFRQERLLLWRKSMNWIDRIRGRAQPRAEPEPKPAAVIAVGAKDEASTMTYNDKTITYSGDLASYDYDAILRDKQRSINSLYELADYYVDADPIFRGIINGVYVPFSLSDDFRLVGASEQTKAKYLEYYDRIHLKDRMRSIFYQYFKYGNVYCYLMEDGNIITLPVHLVRIANVMVGGEPVLEFNCKSVRDDMRQQGVKAQKDFLEDEDLKVRLEGFPKEVSDAISKGGDWVQLNPGNTFVMQGLKEDWMRYAVPMVATCLAAFRRKA